MKIAHLSFKDGTYQNYGAGTNANAFVGGFRMWEAR